jgi:hypothetical protein
MGSLMATANLDAEVIASLRQGLQRTAFERLGLSPALPQAQWVQEVARLTSRPEVATVFSAIDLLSVGQAAAKVEAALMRGGG